MSNQTNQQSNTNNQSILNAQDDDHGGSVISVGDESGGFKVEVVTFYKKDVPSKEEAIECVSLYLTNAGVSVPLEDFAMFVLEMYAEYIEKEDTDERSSAMFAGLISALLETDFWTGAVDTTTDAMNVVGVTKEEFEYWQENFSDDAKAGKLKRDTKHSTTYH